MISLAFQLGIKMSAVMVLMPKITKCIMDGLMPLSERMKEILTKKSQSGEAEFYIGLDPAIILGDSEVVTVGLIFIPLTILIAIIVPGNTILPFGDLATIGFFIGIAVAVHRKFIQIIDFRMCDHVHNHLDRKSGNPLDNSISEICKPNKRSFTGSST
ncbi:MAG: PTS transporter subunit IIC [Anaerostipes hadrus]